MLLALTMPQFGESITQGRLIRWLKKEGDVVQELEPLAEMETEKTVFSYESPVRGTLLKTLFSEDAEISVGTAIAHFEVSETDGKKYLSLGIGVLLNEKENTSGLSPLIKSLAKEQNLSLEEIGKIKGTGPNGRLTKEDFLSYLQKKPSEDIEVITPSPIRLRIAENMTASKQKVPHAGTGLDVDLSAVESGRKNIQEKYSYLSFVAFTVVQSLQKHPLMNSLWKETEEKRWIEKYRAIHLGIATATDQGLLVPVIRNAHQLSFSALSKEIDRLVEGARKSTLKPQDLVQGTFTLNNTGSLGALRSIQIIPPNQSAILAVNRVSQRPTVVENKIEIHPMMSLDLTFDHRLIDGDQAISFLNTIKEKLEKFDFSLLETK